MKKLEATACIFPGQASQYVGMGKDLFDNISKAREMFDHANDILHFDLKKICFEGPDEALKQTRVTQPAIFVHSCIVFSLLEGIPSATAGHSLGEYSALVAARALSFEEALRLVQRRAELMQESGEKYVGTMAAIVGATEETVREICEEASNKGIVQPANFNSPGQIVISGSVDGVREAMQIAKAKGVRMVKELVVSGAFHSPLMQYAQDGLREYLDSAKIEDAIFPVYANVIGEAVQSAEVIRDMLFRQVTSAVLWEKSIRAMFADGVKKMIETGPGNVLQGLVKRTESSITLSGIDTYAQLMAFQEAGE